MEDRLQAAAIRPVRDRAPPVSELEQLLVRNDRPLSAGER
jgi:hypothetical protein